MLNNYATVTYLFKVQFVRIQQIIRNGTIQPVMVIITELRTKGLFVRDEAFFRSRLKNNVGSRGEARRETNAVKVILSQR